MDEVRHIGVEFNVIFLLFIYFFFRVPWIERDCEVAIAQGETLID